MRHGSGIVVSDMTKPKAPAKKREILEIYGDRSLTQKPERTELFVRIEVGHSEKLRTMGESLQQPLHKMVELAIDLLHEDYLKRIAKKR